MLRFLDRWFWRMLALALTICFFILAVKLPGNVCPQVFAAVRKEDAEEKHPLTRLEYAQILLNSHPDIRILTPHLASEYRVTENGVENIVIYDKTVWSPDKLRAEILKRHNNVLAAMQSIGFKDFQAGDIRVEDRPYPPDK
ncbi:MAG: hypothetical protein HYU36_07050 [Planctomycetes bacterium]|nr:hypothetical protein [Planctomycetota bacterium]